jgi:gliding motility-associated-like protein
VSNPVHTYSTYGYFDVTLYAFSTTSCYTLTKKKQFVQIVQPAIHITNLPTYGCAPVVYTPTYIDTVVDGPAQFAWNFGNGNTNGTPNPPGQTYGAGTWNVSVTVTTAGGCTASSGGIVKVGTIKPTPNFTASPTTVCRSTPVNFTDQSINANQWLWEFGDGGTSQSKDTSYTYKQSGTYTVTLIAFNNGCQDSLVKKNYIVVNPPTALFSFTFGCSNNNVLFKDSSIGANTWIWDYGDGQGYTGTPAHPAEAGGHNYAAPGTYNVKLTVTNTASGCTDVITIPVAFYAKVKLQTGQPNICKNALVQFIAVNTDHVSSYDFLTGDGNSSGNSVQSYWSYSYPKTGTYTAKLVATLDNGCLATDSTLIQVNGPKAGFSANDTVSCHPFLAAFTDSSRTDGTHPINNYAWNFGDATPISSGPNLNVVQHPYNTQGMYSISLKVTDASGCSDSITKVSYVTLSIINVKFSNPDSTCPGSPVQFTDSTTGGFNPLYNWTFANGQTSTKYIPPPQVFNSIGSDSARLIVTEPAYGCADTLVRHIIVNVPVASFRLSDTATNCPPLTENFTFTGSYYHTLIWNFDGVTLAQNILNPQHIYTIPRFYYPTVTVISPGGCSATATDTIHVYGPKLNTFEYNPNHGCDTLTVNFSITTSNDIIRYVWNFDDSTPLDTTYVPYVSHFYVAPANYQGLYLPSVTLTNDSGCTVTYNNLADTIYVIDIKAGFKTGRMVGCTGYPLRFQDTTKTNGRITNYFWDFGDGQTLNSTNPDTSHVYVNPGNYIVREVITTQFGCSSADTVKVTVVQNPEFDITGGLSQCVPAAIQFTAVNLAPDTSNLSYSWNFYNGQAPVLKNPPPIQLYPQPGNDSVQLIVTNSSGCTDTATTNFTIYPLPPVFIGNDTTICLGDSIPFNATGAASYTWLPPGNSTLSCTNCPNPVGRPRLSTTYIVEGTSIHGCQANDTIVVTVNQPVHVSVTPSDSVCNGQAVTLQANGAAIYAWTPAGSLSNPTVANPMASPNITTTYTVVGYDNKYCFSDTQHVNVTVFDYPTINVGPDQTLLVGSSYQVPGTGSADIISINWLPVTGLSCTNCLSPLASPQNTTTYVVDVVNNGGCKTSDTLKITVICNNNNIFVPNTFSPNGDGVNDVFYVRGKGLNTIPSMTIFNRWGQIVFQKKDFAPNDPTAGWDGTINGKPAPIDVYIYTIDIICDNSALVPIHGNVALIR